VAAQVLPRLDPRGFPEVSFPGKESYAHVCTGNPDCFGCNTRKMLVRPIAVERGFKLIPASMKLLDGRFVVIPDCSLVFPDEHVTNFFDLPGDWTARLQRAGVLFGLKPDDSFNRTINNGPRAGQTGAHMHDWLIKRGVFDEAFGSNLGLMNILVYLSHFGFVLPYVA
jgi:hypothetical protein